MGHGFVMPNLVSASYVYADERLVLNSGYVRLAEHRFDVLFEPWLKVRLKVLQDGLSQMIFAKVHRTRGQTFSVFAFEQRALKQACASGDRLHTHGPTKSL